MAEPSPRQHALVALLLFGVALALYAPTASFGFVEYDDPSYVRDNPYLAHGLDRESVRWAWTSRAWAYNWHPLTWLSHGLDVELFELEPGGHHVVNALLHALGAALLYRALVALTGRAGPSAVVAALFAVHPLRVESVAWIAERKDVLAGVFFALTLLAYARYARAPSGGRYACVALALALGLLAKPTLVTVPFLLLVLDAWPLARLRERGLGPLVREKLPLLGLSLVSCWMTLAAQEAGGAFRFAVGLSERCANALIAYATYLGQFVWPRDLAVFYPHPAVVEPGVSRLVPALAAATLLAALTVVAVRVRKRMPWVLAGWVWYLGTLVPMSGLVQVGGLAHADRYAYLSLIGIEVALAWSLAELVARRPTLRPAVVAGGAAALLALAFTSARQLAVWRDNGTLAEHALAVTDKNYVAHFLLAQTRTQEERLDEALAEFEAAAAILPSFFQAQLCVGRARLQRDEPELARAALERALAIHPGSGEAHLCLAAALERQGELRRAEEELQAALRLQPGLGSEGRTQRLRQRIDEGLGR